MTGAGGADVRPILLGDGWHEDRPGGLNRYLADLLAALRKRGINSRGALLGPATGAPVGVLAGGRLGQPLAVRLWHLQRAARRAGADATVVDAHFALSACWPVTIGALRNLPLVVHFQGPWAEESAVAEAGRGWRVRVKRLVELSVYRRAQRIVVLSSAFKRLLVEQYGIRPWVIEVVHPGVDMSRFRPGDRDAARACVGVTPGQPTVLTVRRLVPRMGLDVLLSAWPLVRAEHPDAVLLVAGEGPEKARLEALADELGVGSSVRFLGRVDEDTLVSCYQAADVSVVPTAALEGFGLIVLESLACGTPVIVSDVGALPEAVSRLDASLIVPAHHPGALGRRLAGALSGASPVPDAAACRRYAQTFGWAETAKRHEAIYAEAPHPGPRRPRVVYLDHCARLSGGELALLRLLPSLSGVDAHVILGEEGPLVGRLHRANASVEVKPMAEAARDVNRSRVRPGRLPGAGAMHSVAYALMLARRLRALRPDIVHTNSLKAAIYGGVAGRLAGVPVVWHVRDRIADDYMPKAAVRLVRAAARRLPAAIIANSQATLETLGPMSVRTAVIPSPIAPELLKDGSASVPPADRPLRIGIVGRLARWKGQNIFLEAFARAFPEGSELAVVVGAALFDEGDYEVELQKLVSELGIEDRVEFTGFVDDVGIELARLDIVVHASLSPEPFGLVVVEAMAVGLAVVVANAGGPAETVDDGVNGLLYPPGDANALAEALRRLVDDAGLRRQLGEAARERARDFTPEIVAGKVMAVYRSLPGGSLSELPPGRVTRRMRRRSSVAAQ